MAKENEVVAIAIAFPERVAHDDGVTEKVAHEENLGVYTLVLEIQ